VEDESREEGDSWYNSRRVVGLVRREEVERVR